MSFILAIKRRLGTDNIANFKKIYRSFEESKKFVQSLGLKSFEAYIKWSKSGKRPEDIPSNPQRRYKKDWKGWPDFLGNDNIATKNLEFWVFEKAREYVHGLD